MEGPKKRFTTSVLGSGGLNFVGGAGAAGVLLGRGETLAGKIGDAMISIPRAIVNTINYYIHAPEYTKQADAALTYLREQGPEVAGELGRSGRYLEAGVRQADRGMSLLKDAQDYLVPGGERGFDPQNSYYSLKDGIQQLGDAIESIEIGKDQAIETAGPVIDTLKQVDINPILEALHNLADNVAPDEIWYTLGVAAASLGTAYLASQYVRGFWGRRGRPGMVARFIQKRGIKKFRDYYIQHPEKIAGDEAINVIGEHFAKNPKRLEELAAKAGYEISKRNS